MQIFLRSANATTIDDEGGYTWLYPAPVVFGEPGDKVEVCVSLLQFFPVQQNLPTPQAIVINYSSAPIEQSAYLITIPAGQWSVDQITAAYDNITSSFASPRVRFTYDDKTLRARIASDDQAFFSIIITPTLAAALGLDVTGGAFYENGTLYYDPLTFATTPVPPSWYLEVPSGVLEGIRPVNFAGSTHLVMESSLQTTNVLDETLSSSVLCKIPVVGTGFGDLQTYQDTSTFSTLADSEITSLSVRFRNSFGEPVVFDTPWNMTLLFRVTPTGAYRPLEAQYSRPPEETDDGSRSEMASDRAQST